MGFSARILKISLLSGGLLLAACASVATRLPEVSLPDLEAEQHHQEKLAFDEISRLQERLLKVAYPILSANTEICPKTRRDIGVRTHSLKSYSKALRDGAARERGAKDKPHVLFVLPGSSAERAGIKAGDQLLDLMGNPIGANSKALRALIEPEKGGLKPTQSRALYVQRGEDRINASLTPIEICDYKIKLSMRSTINAYATGREITITSGMMNFTKNDEELALIIGHELAHNTMGHIRKIVGNTILSGFATRYTRPFESESDYVGLYYLARAGYDMTEVEDVWRRMALIGPRSVARAKTHPTYPDRFLRLAAARREIAAKQAAGLPLIPNFKQGGQPQKTEQP